MSDYQRYTVTPTREIFEKADEAFTERAGLQRTKETHHSVTYSGAEGTVTVDVHRHGQQNDVVIRTDQLRTSKLDGVARYFLNQLPYQAGDPVRQ